MKKTITVLLLFMFAFQGLIAQSRMVSGNVSDETNSPLPGVNIVIKGTLSGATTDFDGNYSVEVPNDNQILVFMFIGYQDEELDVSGQSMVNVSMIPASETLDEIVVTALSIERQERSL